MTDQVPVLRYAAFAAEAGGGNPAGIVLDASRLTDAQMQAIAAEVGYAETAFVVGRDLGDARRLRLRYFSPGAEVPFCGHATIATAVVLATQAGAGPFHFDTPVGPIVISTERHPDGVVASFTSVEPRLAELYPDVAHQLLSLVGLSPADLDARYPLRVSFAGNWHPVVMVRDRARFDEFSFDPQKMRALMDAEGWQGTVTVGYAIGATEFEVRNLFPVGTLTEDPATGSAAASLGGYLRSIGAVDAPVEIQIHQGAHVGRPSLLRASIPADGGITVSGNAVEITE
ncbi:MAG TPA: PhzF family phenazine biosynthesis protein [Glaciihabitans sp.]|jgi:PhzF family phenazine biosynthesis protein|nr:PhzF family phenazine biosynthesis protein [Glaciihabitans sp.]